MRCELGVMLSPCQTVVMWSTAGGKRPLRFRRLTDHDTLPPSIAMNYLSSTAVSPVTLVLRLVPDVS